MYVDVARTYALFVRNKRKIFNDIPGYIFITTYRNCKASRVYETCSQLCMFKKCLILLRPSAKMTFHCYLQWIWGPNNMTVSLFSWSTWVRVATKVFWKHLWETPSQTCISFCGTAVLAWCVPSLELCLKSVNSKDNGAQNMMLRSTDHVCKCKKHDVA